MPRVVVTGTSSGIGKYAALYLLSKGIEVIGVSRRSGPTEFIEKKGYIHIQGDLTSPSTVDAIVKAVGSEPLEGVIFNAGILESVTKIANTKLAEFKHVFNVNLFSVVDLTRALIPALRASKGRAIYVSSGAATNSYSGWGAYGSSKAALNLFASTVAKEEPDITVLSVAPGVVDTGMQQQIRDTHVGRGEMGAAEASKFLELKASGKLVDPRDSGELYGRLVLKTPKELSGQFLRYDDETLAKIQ